MKEFGTIIVVAPERMVDNGQSLDIFQSHQYKPTFLAGISNELIYPAQHVTGKKKTHEITKFEAI